MICRIGDVVRCGSAVSIAADVDPAAVATAVRRESGPDDRIAVSCPDPSLLHDSVGCISADMGLRSRTALARAARTRGITTPYDGDLRAAREELEAIDVDTTPLAAHRERVAETESAVDRARVRAAEARGGLRERRENGMGAEEAEDRLDDALRDLSEAETSAIAARQAYDRARERRRDRRDIRERRRRLQDRAANLERRARSHLVDQLRDGFRDALATVPGSTLEPEDDGSASDGAEHDLFEADPVSAALAIARLGEMAAPVVLAVDRFDSPEYASEWLDAPVVHV